MQNLIVLEKFSNPPVNLFPVKGFKKNFSSLKKNSESKQIALNKILKLVEHKSKYSDFLIEISKAISDDICLSEIYIDKKNATKFFDIKGHAKDPGSIMTFVNNLSKVKGLEQVEIISIKQLSEKNASYYFELRS